jgi:hypothetical protein
VKRCSFVLLAALLATIPLYSKASNERPKHETWYEQALRHINPANIDYGAIWDERKRAILDQIGNRYFQYSVASTAVIVVLFALLGIQHVSHNRSLDIAAQSIADAIRHDEYSRRVAREAIERYNEHINACNRAIETKPEGLSKSILDTASELQRIRQELEDTRAENKSLRNDIAKNQKILAEIGPQEKADQRPAVQKEKEFEPGHLTARIHALEKQVRAEQRKNQHGKGTSVHDHRA